MSLATFSAILGFAIQAERAALDTIGALGAPSPGEAESLGRIRVEVEKSLRQLETILRENVTELVMEPCEPLDPARYSLSEEPSLAGVLRLVGVQRDYLRDASRVVNLREVRRALDKLATRKEQLLTDLT